MDDYLVICMATLSRRVALSWGTSWLPSFWSWASKRKLPFPWWMPSWRQSRQAKVCETQNKHNRVKPQKHSRALLWNCTADCRKLWIFESLSIVPTPVQYTLDRICCLDVIIPTCMVFFEILGWQMLGVIIESCGCFQLVMLLAFEVVLLQVPRLK